MKAYLQLHCSEEFTSGIYGKLICFSVLNIFLSITASFGNTLILVALRKETSLHPPSKLLLRCLATSDLCVGLITEPFIVTYWMSKANESFNICRYTLLPTFITSYILVSVSLLTLTAISVDRLLALLLGLRYRQVVTLKRTYVVVIAIWLMSIVCTTLSFLSRLITIWYSYLGTLMCLTVSISSYTKIFLTLRRQQTQVQDIVRQEQPSQATPRPPLNIARYRKAVSSILWLQITLAVCYIPYGVTDSLRTYGYLSSSINLAGEFSLTIVYLNSSLNPLLYCWKITEMRQAVKDTIRQLCCRFM